MSSTLPPRTQQFGELRPRAIPVLGQLLHELHALNLTHEQLVRFLDPRRECELVHVKAMVARTAAALRRCRTVLRAL